MATKKGNGHDPATSAIVEVLERIEGALLGLRGDVGELRGELIEVRGELIEVRGELGAFKVEVGRALTEIHHEIADTNVRVSDLRSDLRTSIEGRLAKLETESAQRLGKLEAVVFRPTGT